MAGGSDLGRHMEAVARALLGDPNPRLSSVTELRWGSHGALSVDLKKGVWHDHQSGEGGGVLDLLRRERGIANGAAFEFLAEIGIEVGDERLNDRREAGRAKSAGKPKLGPIVATYVYEDEAGKPVLRVNRHEPKTFRQWRPAQAGDDPSRIRDGWFPSFKGCRHVPYRLPEMMEDIAAGYAIYVVEGEKDVDNLRAIGVPATCNAGGAGKWPDELTEHFRDADVILLPDNDPQAENSRGEPLWHEDGRPQLPGQDHADQVGSHLHGVARSVRFLHLPDLPPKGDASDWLAAGGTAEALYDLVERQGRAWAPPFSVNIAPPKPFTSRFGAVPWRDLDLPGAQHEWLIKGLLARGEIGMLAGPMQSGKSFLAIDLAMCVARGIDWMGRRVLRGGVVYQAGESARGVRRKRLPAYRLHHGLTAADELPFVLLQSPVDLYASDDPTEALIAECRHWAGTFGFPLELLVIDTWSAATPGANENASEDVSRVLARCARIARELNCAILLVHHMNAGGDKPRGHTSIPANLDAVVTVKKADAKDERGREIREARIAKAKDGEDGLTWQFVLPAVELGRDEDGDPITSCVVQPVEAQRPDASGGRRKRLSDKAAIFLRAIREEVGERGEAPPAVLQLPYGVLVTRYDHVRDRFRRLQFYEADTAASTIRSDISRAGSELLRAHVIGRNDPYIWIAREPSHGTT